VCGITIKCCILKQILSKNVPWRVTSVTLESSPVGERMWYYVTNQIRVRVGTVESYLALAKVGGFHGPQDVFQREKYIKKNISRHNIVRSQNMSEAFPAPEVQ
jgi:hypothetical protein